MESLLLPIRIGVLFIEKENIAHPRKTKRPQYVDEIPRRLTTYTLLDCLFSLCGKVHLSLNYSENMESQTTKI